MDELRELSKELGHPSAEKLWIEARRKRIEVTRKQVYAFASAQPARQVLGRRPENQGKITSFEINERWAADIIDYNAHPAQDPNGGDPYQYILIVQDIFSRKIWAHALKSKSQEVCQQAFESIIRRAGTPDELDTDNGNEFKGPFHEYLVDERIQHEVADARSKNARATLDSAIKSLRQLLARLQLSDRTRNWASVLQRGVDAYHRVVHAALIGRAPQNVYWDKVLQFDLRTKAIDARDQNQKILDRRAGRLQQLGAFREEVLQKNKFERSFTPRFGDQVHRVQSISGNRVVDEEGRSYPIHHVQAVSGGSADVDTSGMRGGSERIDRVRLQALEPYRQRIQDFVGDGKTENEVARFMKAIGMATLMHAGFNYRKALVLLGYAVGQGRGSSTAMVTKQATVAHAAAPVPAAAPPIPPPVEAPPALLRRVTGKRPPLTPAEAAANVRRRITGKRPAPAA